MALPGDDFSKYAELQANGVGPQEIYQIAKHDGLDRITRIRLIRTIFSFSLVEAKEVMVVGDGWATSLMEYQESLVPLLQELLDQETLTDAEHDESDSIEEQKRS